MSRWTDPVEWARLRTPAGCPICTRGEPSSIIAELPASWVVMGEANPPLPGTCALFLKRHAIELHDLTEEEGAAWMRDIRHLSRVLAAASGATKMNYEVHGNTIPHLHMHFFPRYAGDPFENRPIDPRLEGGPSGFERHGEIRQRVIEAFASESKS